MGVAEVRKCIHLLCTSLHAGPNEISKVVKVVELMERLIQLLRGILWDDLHHSSTKPSSKVDPPSCSGGLSSETVVELNKATGKFRKNDQGEGSALRSRKEDVPVGAVAAVTPLGIDSKFLLSRQGYLDVTSEDDPLFADYEVRELSKYMATYFSSLTAIENREHRRDVNKTKASLSVLHNYEEADIDEAFDEIDGIKTTNMPWENRAWHAVTRRERRRRARGHTVGPSCCSSRAASGSEFSLIASSLDWDGENYDHARHRPEDDLVPLFDEIDFDIATSQPEAHQSARAFNARTIGMDADDALSTETSPFICHRQRTSHARRKECDQNLRERMLKVGELYSYLGIDNSQQADPQNPNTDTLRSAVYSAAEFESYGADDGEVEACVDSGTSVPVDHPGNYDKKSVDDSETLTLMGFNKSTTKARGVVHETVAVTADKSGRRIRLKFPKTHLVDGAPNFLLSVSKMCDVGYKFAFSKAGGRMTTPDGHEVNLIRRSGLYWLKFKRAAPYTIQPRKKRRSTPNAEAFGATAASQFAELRHDYDACICNSALENDDVIVDDPARVVSVEKDPVIHGDPDSREPFLVSNCTLTRRCTECAPSPHRKCGLTAAALNVPGAFATICSHPISDTGSFDSEEQLAACFNGRSVSVPLQLLHQRLGHISERLCRRISKQQLSDIRLSDRSMGECEVCKESKAKRASFGQNDEEDGTLAPFEHVVSDLKGAMKHPDVWGNRYFVTFSCKRTRWIAVYFMKKKSQTKDKFKEFLSWTRRHRFEVKSLRTDGGGEYTSGEEARVLSDFETVGAANKIEHTKTSANTPEQNGLAERVNRTLAEKARCMLRAQALSPRLWSSAVLNAAAIHNRIPHSALSGLSPHHLVFDKPPILSRYRTFGCDMWMFTVNVIH